MTGIDFEVIVELHWGSKQYQSVSNALKKAEWRITYILPAVFFSLQTKDIHTSK